MSPNQNISVPDTFSSEQLPRLSFIMIRASNLQASLDFYSSLGLVFEEHKHGTGPVHYACDAGSWVFEIYPALKSETTENVVRIGFTVKNIGKLYESLQSLNIDFQSTLTDSPWGLRMVVFDPDLNRVELTEQK